MIATSDPLLGLSTGLTEVGYPENQRSLAGTHLHATWQILIRLSPILA
jgi:hypothetical protein